MMSAGLVALAILILGAMIAPRTTTPRPAVESSPVVGRYRSVAQRGVVSIAQRWATRGRHQVFCTPEAVASWCDAVARSVRSGSTLRAAVSAVQADDRCVREALAGAQRRLQRGDDLGTAMRSGSTEVTGRHLDAACHVIAVVADVGGSSSAPLDRVAAALRMRAADEQERVAQAAQARMSSRVLTVVPIAVLAILMATDPDVLRIITQPIGASCVCLGLALNLAGNRWMNRMIGRAS